MKKILIIIILANINAFAQPLVKPKLVVGIVVDQMRYDYIYKYWYKFGKGGFKKLVTQGYFYENTHYNYSPTVTAAGHASIYTGATPSMHGIVGNDWYNASTKKTIYCTEDANVQSVGGDINTGKMSPINMLSSTIGDELHLAQQNNGKVIGISIKDRSSILPAGHSGNGAYWYDGKTGNFITSTFYQKELPIWVNDFNNKNYPAYYTTLTWNPLYPINEYSASSKDDNEYEDIMRGEARPIFPHIMKNIYDAIGNYSYLAATPYGNTIVKDLALAAIENEQLGKSSTYTDLLAISFSSTDYIGHQYGTNAIEIEDTYLRLDKDLEELLNYIEKNIGKNNVLLFLTADHGAALVPAMLKDYKIPAAITDGDYIMDSANKHLKEIYKVNGIIEENDNNQIFYNQEIIKNEKLNEDEITEAVISFLQKQPGIKDVFDSKILQVNTNSSYVLQMLSNGYYYKRFGQVVYTLDPAWLMYKSKGTSHGTHYTYDTHVPLIWWGNVSKGKSSNYTTITQIAPTIANFLQIEKPNACISNPLDIKRNK